MLHQEVPIDSCLGMVGLVQKMPVTGEVNPQLVFKIKQFVEPVSLLVHWHRTSRLFT
jgi:hypothetical protein